MSDANNAVFLSYASQDAEAARRIAEALRAAGVEVWFDQSELRGGDSWDQSIRKQIKECTLFAPIVSANTQARREGYFRLEWKLADDRTHLMAKGTPFLVPVCVDDTKDWDAIVPDSFMTVQWTRLGGGEAPPKFCERVKQLLRGPEPEVPRPRPAQRDGGVASPATPSRSGSWTLPAIGGAAVLAAVAALFALRPRSHSEEPAKAAAAPAVAVSAQPLSEARKLERQARALIDDDPLRVRENYRTACELCERATTLSPDDADAWATYARASCVLFADYNERGDKATAAARLRAERAIRLAPDSLEANLASAQYAIQVGGDEAGGERQLRSLLERAPNDRRILRALARAAGELVDRQPEKLAESRQWAERAEALPGGDTLALTELGWGYWGLNRYQELDALLDRVLTRQPTSDAYHLKVMVLGAWGDMDGVLHWLEKIPPAVLSEDRVAAVAIDAYLSKRQPDRALALLARLPREFLEEGRYLTPKSYLAGLALRMAGKPRAAEIEFRSALKTVEDRIVAKPNDARLFNWKGRILAQLGDQAGAARVFETGRELNPNPSSTIAPGDLVLLGRYDEAIAGIDAFLQRDRSRWPSFFSQLKFSQDFDPLRNDARFVALIARGDGWLREMRSPPATNSAAATIAPAANDKSVAVLAFADLSAAHDSEYFSDGISEELLNVLAKVPGLKVTARTSAFFFKGKQVQLSEIAKQLGVAYVIEGSVRKSGSKVRITAQLIKAEDGFHVWSDNFDRELKDIFAVQDEIAGLIAKQLSLKLGTSSAASKAAVNPEAFELYLQALQTRNLRRFDLAESMLNRALALEPNFARAHAALAVVWLVRPNESEIVGQSNSPEYARIRAKITQALTLDPYSAEAHASLGLALHFQQKDSEAESALRRAVALSPNYSAAHEYLGSVLLNRGQMDEAQERLKLATELDPVSAPIWNRYGQGLNHAGRLAEGLIACERALSLSPTSSAAFAGKITALVGLGRFTEAVALVRQERSGNATDADTKIFVLARAGLKAEAEALLAEPRSAANNRERPRSFLALGRTEEAMALMTPEWAKRYAAISYLWDPIFDPVRNDPRWLKLIADAGLTEAHARAQAWRAAHPPERPEMKK